MTIFVNASSAFAYYLFQIRNYGMKNGNTKRLMNVGFTILFPMDNKILVPERKWNERYAQREWAWYLTGSRSVLELKKFAPIWDTMHNGDHIVNSNYGYQWNRNNQLQKVIDLLRENAQTRRAVISIYDGKEIDDYKFDTPCTLNITFNIINGNLDMTVIMRINDLWYGFCNDQYCFSMLMKYVADQLGIPVGKYHHIALDLHLYDDKL